MFKLLLLLLGVWIVLTILKQGRPPPTAEKKTGSIVRCDVCGLHFLETEGFTSSGRYYCSEAHFLQRKQI